ncbi:MAG: hypothetical protein FWD36_10205 [Treponema sp.]|nr:hypothetical protein [Treponema sp.]
MKAMHKQINQTKLTQSQSPAQRPQSSPQSPVPSPQSLFLFLFLISHFSFLILLSCASAPQISDVVVAETEFVPLDQGAVVYLFADVPKARPILNDLAFIDMNDKQIQQILDRTQSATAAIYVPSGEKTEAEPPDLRRYQLVAWGNYPASAAKMAFGSNKGWKKRRSSVSGQQYWYAEKSSLSIAILPRQIRVSAAIGNNPGTSTDPFSDISGTVIPEGFNTFRRGAILACWVDTPAPLINQQLAKTGIPLEFPAEQLFVSLFPASAQENADSEYLYDAFLRVQVSSDAQARALTTLFTIARGFISPNALDANPLLAILFANPFEQDGNSLTITMNGLSGREVSLLFNLFSL